LIVVHVIRHLWRRSHAVIGNPLEEAKHVAEVVDFVEIKLLSLATKDHRREQEMK
jgi:hypothetical protein